MAITDIRTEELNNRLYDRNVPTTHLENWYTPTPMSTKFMKFPSVNCNGNTREKLIQTFTPAVLKVNVPVYDVAADFAPVTRTAPFRGFSKNINTESSLRNQFYALQKSDRAVWVPSSTSDLYIRGPAVGRQEEQTHPLLFKREETMITSNHPNVENIGRNLFMNNTRTQLRGT
jgi:hypothetical protein